MHSSVKLQLKGIHSNTKVAPQCCTPYIINAPCISSVLRNLFISRTLLVRMICNFSQFTILEMLETNKNSDYPQCKDVWCVMPHPLFVPRPSNRTRTVAFSANGKPPWSPFAGVLPNFKIIVVLNYKISFLFIEIYV